MNTNTAKWPTPTMRNVSIGTILAEPRNNPKAFARMATCRHRGSLLPTFDINAADGGHTPRLSKLSGIVGLGTPRDPALKSFIEQL